MMEYQLKMLCKLNLINKEEGITVKEVRINRAIEFAKHDQEKLEINLYRPIEIGKYPGIIILYGGAWQRVNPNYNEEFSRYMAAQGYAVVAISLVLYRKVFSLFSHVCRFAKN